MSAPNEVFGCFHRVSSLLLFPTFWDFSYFFLLFHKIPTFWLLKAKFCIIFCNFLEILQLFFDFVSKICNIPVNFEDFRKFLFNFEKMSLFLTN